MLGKINFTWKYLSLVFLALAVFLFLRGEIYARDCEAGDKCAYLPAGEYGVEIEYHNAQKGNQVTLWSGALVSGENGQGTALWSQECPLGEGTLQGLVSVPENAREISLLAAEGSIEGWRIQSVKLTNYDNYFLAFLFCLLAAGSFLYGGKVYREEHNAALLLAGLGVLASLPLFNNFLIAGHDTAFHLARINGIYEGLRTGQFPVRINPVQLEGYGNITGVMYPQLFLYIPAVLKFLNISSVVGLKLLYFGANVGTAFLSYYGVKNICREHRTALMAAVFYTVNPYRLVNIYVRGALGECLAMVFLPLVFWGIWEILWNRRERWYLLMIGMTGVLSSHILSLELYAVLILAELFWWLVSADRGQTAKRLLNLGMAALGVVVLNLYFLGPFLRFSGEGLHCYAVENQMETLTVDLMRVFEPFARWDGEARALGMKYSMSVTLGSVLLAGIVLFCARLLTREESGSRMKAGRHCLVLGSGFLLMTLWVAPWETLLHSEWLESVLRALQFPWRLLGVSAFLFSVVAAVAVTEWEKGFRRAAWLCPIMVAAALLSCGYFFGDVARQADTEDKLWAEGADYTDALYLCRYSMPLEFYDEEYAHIICDEEEHMAWMSAREQGQQAVCGEPKSVVWQNYQKRGVSISADVAVAEEAGDSVRALFPLHYYPGYEVRIDGERVEVQERLSLVACDIPGGMHHIEVFYRGLSFFTACDLVSLGGLLCLALWRAAIVIKRGKEKDSEEA